MPAVIRPASSMAVQLRDLVAGQIERGALVPGDKLPPVRDLAVKHGVSQGTAARAVRMLARGGLVETRGRAGTFVVRRPGQSGSATTSR